MKTLFKKCLNIAKKFIIKYQYIFYMFLPLVAMDIATRAFGNNINFFKLYRFVPNCFTILWISLFLGIALSLEKKIGKWIYLFINFLFLAFYLVNNVYFSMTNNFFNFSLVESASEGSPYFWMALKNCNKWVYIVLIVIIILIVWAFKNIPDKNKNNYKVLIITIISFLALHSITPLFLGKANEELVWSTWKNPRNIYISFNDSNKSMQVSGLFEYTLRDFYVAFLRPQKTNTKDLEFLDEIYKEEVINDTNKYTGKFADKNLIFIQLEGLDNWLITKKDTPTLYKMMNNSLNFSKHYSFYNGGGSTFNSEFAVNTGFIVPISYNQNAYTFNNNNFPYSMAKIFKDKGYMVNAFHMNSKEYYSRGINYQNWGYDNYYSLIDMYDYDDDSYKLDRELILNEEYSNLMFPKDTKFVDYLITYSNHLPFTNTSGVCKQLYDLDNLDSNQEFEQMTEEECVRRQVKETDYMMELLLQKLTEQNLIDNTIIVVFTDHYLYTLEDKTILDKYKTTSNNLINQTPFFIWNNGNDKKNIKKVTSQLNILPTVLNLFGIEYNKVNYIAEDALNNDYAGIVFFSDYSWYDGNVYVEGGNVTNNKKIKASALESKNTLVNNLIMKNDLTLKYNYFKNIGIKKQS